MHKTRQTVLFMDPIQTLAEQTRPKLISKANLPLFTIYDQTTNKSARNSGEILWACYQNTTTLNSNLNKNHTYILRISMP